MGILMHSVTDVESLLGIVHAIILSSIDFCRESAPPLQFAIYNLDKFIEALRVLPHASENTLEAYH